MEVGFVGTSLSAPPWPHPSGSRLGMRGGLSLGLIALFPQALPNSGNGRWPLRQALVTIPRTNLSGNPTNQAFSTARSSDQLRIGGSLVYGGQQSQQTSLRLA